MTDQQPDTEHHASKHTDEPKPNGMDWSAVDQTAEAAPSEDRPDEETQTDEEVVADIVKVFEDGGADLDALSAAIVFALEQGLTEVYVSPVAAALSKAGARHLGYAKAELVRRITRELRDTYGTQAEAPEPEIDHEAREVEAAEASKALRADPNLLETGVDLVHRMGVVGETSAIKAVLLASASRLTMKPVSLLLQGESSGGKSTVLLETIKLTPPECLKILTTFSPKSLIYDREFNYAHSMIVLLEAAPLAAKKESEQAHMLRTLLSEGKIIHQTVVSDEEGRPHLETIEKEGPTSLLTCNVLDHLDIELMTRLITVGIDGGPEQTRKVLSAAALRAAGEEEVDFDPELKVWHGLFRWMAYQPTRVVIPFAVDLQRLITIAHTRTRRDFNQLVSMITASALLHQSQREVDAEGRIIAEMADYAHAREALGPGIDQSSDRKPPTDIARLISMVMETIAAEEEPKAQGGKKFAARPGVRRTMDISIRALANRLHATKSSVHRWVKTASDEGFLINHNEGSRRPLRLEILAEPQGSSSSDVLPSPEAVVVAMKEKKHTRGGRDSVWDGTAGQTGTNEQSQ